MDDPQYGVVPLGNNLTIAGATVTLANVTVPSGALIVVLVNENSGVSGSLADGGTNTYANASNSPVSFNAAGSKLYTFFVANCGALSGATLTYTKGTSGVTTQIAAFYVPGIATASAEDTAAAASATGNSASISVTSGTPAQNADLLVAVAGSIASTTFGAATGWNAISSASNGNASLGVFTGAVRGGLAPSTFTSAVTSNQWGGAIVAFKYASAPGGFSGVNGWAPSTTYTAGSLIRQSDLSKVAIGNERVFVCYNSTGGTGQSAASEPTITATRGALTTDNTVKWQEATGVAALNGDLTNTPTWAQMKANSTTATLGQVIQSGDGTKILICTVSGTVGGSEPSPWAAYTTTGATTTDNGATWVTLAAVPSGFSNWGAPHARLANAFAANWGAAGNAFFMASEHAELQATAMTLTSPGSAASPCFVYCVNKSNVPPGSANLTTGGSFNTIGASNVQITGTAGGATYYRGITVNCGSLASTATLAFATASSVELFMDTCVFNLNNTSGASVIQLNGSGFGGVTVWNNCNVSFGSIGQSIAANSGRYFWRNGSLLAGTAIPTNLINPNVTNGLYFLIQGVDLSLAGSGKTLVAALIVPAIITIQDCKLNAALSNVAATPTRPLGIIYLVRSDSSGTNYRHESYQYTGTQTVETTIIRTGGASDGTTGISWKIAATGNSRWVLPFESIPITQWVDTTGSHTVTVYGTTTGGGVPNNDDIWVEVEYLGASGNPQGSIATTTKSDNLAASTTTNNSSDGSTWGGGGAGNGFKMVVPAFTINQKGYINVTIKVAKASATYYIDPEIVVS